MPCVFIDRSCSIVIYSTSGSGGGTGSRLHDANKMIAVATDRFMMGLSVIFIKVYFAVETVILSILYEVLSVLLPV